MLIDVLTREGMSELLLHLVNTDPPDDPVIAKKIQIAQHKILYGRAGQMQGQRLESFDRTLAGLRELIKQYPDHEQRPMWQADLSELLLFDYLQVLKQNAAEFVEFAVPTENQVSAFENAVVEAYEQLADADYRFSQLQTQLPRQADHIAKRINTGLWNRMINQYYAVRTQFFLAHAAHYVALLDDEHHYYQNLGHNPLVRNQHRGAVAERQRLNELTVQRLEKFVTDTRDPNGIRYASLCLTGRAQVFLGHYDVAFDNLDKVIAAGQADLNTLVAKLAWAKAMNLVGQRSDAVGFLEKLADDSSLVQTLLTRLLVVDLEHLILKASTAGTGDPDNSHAYSVYESLLSRPSLATQAEPLRFYIYRRWADSIPIDVDLSQLPAVVVLGIGQTARADAQDLVNQASQAAARNENDEAQVLMAQARPSVDRATRSLRSLLGRRDLPGNLQAAVLYNLGLAVYLDDSSNVDNTIEAARLWIDLAESMPNQADAENAIGLAVAQLKRCYQDPRTRHVVAEDYQRAVQVLFTEFGTSTTADQERYEYAIDVLLPQGQQEEAIRMLLRVPFGHAFYFEARRQILSLQVKNLRGVPATERIASVQQIRSDIAQLIEEAGRAMATADGSLQQHNAASHYRLLLADLALAIQSPTEALVIIDEVMADTGENRDLLARAWSKRIFALASDNQYEQCADQAKKMMGQFPDVAAQVINDNLIALNQKVDDLNGAAVVEMVADRKRLLRQQSVTMARTASHLADLLLQWAKRQALSEQEMLPYQLISAKSLRLAGRGADALRILDPLLGIFPNDAQLAHEAGETLFDLHEVEHLAASGQHFKRIIMSFDQPPYPHLWWNAWMRWFQICEAMGQYTQDIPLRVRKLRLSDQNLGGDPYRSEMQRLANKYGQ